ncbi:MAG TPA: hypothetical protein VMQ61_18295 [Thermoanaerobaculia bacterium]|nr:hypothetical protein [Thermoanaerobaculia bacterium]
MPAPRIDTDPPASVTALVASTYSYPPVPFRLDAPCPGSPATPSPYEDVFVELISASCIWITRSRSPEAIAVEAPVAAPSVIDVAPAATEAVPG